MMKSFLISTIYFSFGYTNGQNYEDGQTGTNKVLLALQSFKWHIQNICFILADKGNLNHYSNYS